VQDKQTGQSESIDNFIKDYSHDPSSYQFARASQAKIGWSKGKYVWIIKYAFRAKNAFGGLVLNNVTIYTQDGMMHIKKEKE
jgi:hypothetical protein